ncbi:DUF4143 domain-containing protein, partial [Myxococcota bacterium]|nr:DUF4143 domain-containing protein [Myxococcota bacterium]
LYSVPVYTRRERVRQVNPKKIYMVDTGLLSAASVDITKDLGALLENLVYLVLRRKRYIIEYFMDSNGFEVDFIARDPLSGAVVHVVQVSLSIAVAKTRAREERALLSCLRELDVPEGIIVTWRDESSVERDPSIKIVPFYAFGAHIT